MSARISLQNCRSCGKFWHTPLPSCPYCAAANVQEAEVDGRGKVYSWVTVHRSLESPPRTVPYVIVTIDLDAGARVFGRLEAAREPKAGDGVVCSSVDRERNGALTFRTSE